MKRLILIILLAASIVLLDVGAAFTQELAAVPIGKKGWKWDVSAAVPLFKIVGSESGSARMDVLPMIGIGGGLTFYWGPVDDPDNEKLISVNFPTLVLNERETDGANLDLTLVADVGFFDNRIRIGTGYEFGKLNYSRSRFIGVFSVGIEF